MKKVIEFNAGEIIEACRTALITLGAESAENASRLSGRIVRCNSSDTEFKVVFQEGDNKSQLRKKMGEGS